MASKIPRELAVTAGAGLVAVAAWTGLAIGLGSVFLGPGKRRRGTAQEIAPSSDNTLMLEPLLDRLDRIEARVSAVEARLTPAATSVAELDSRIQRQTKDIEALQVQMGETRQRETDGDLARLATLFVEVKHPLYTGTIVR